VQAQLGRWLTKVKDRTPAAFHPQLNQSVFPNLGSVDKWGVDGSVAWSPVRQFTGYVFGAWNDSEIKDTLQVGGLPVGVTCDNIDLSVPANVLQDFRTRPFPSG